MSELDLKEDYQVNNGSERLLFTAGCFVIVALKHIQKINERFINRLVCCLKKFSEVNDFFSK
ncbi:MAG TPA: hypothetical protein VK253_04470 [Candidatus Binatia bacterium]|nr:hypothetical protein [Candidatus Binatia bacterium]